MKKIYFALLLFSLVAISVFNDAIHAQTSDFVIQNADGSKLYSILPSPDLNVLIENVVERFVIEHANGNRFYDLTPISDELQTLIGEVSDRFVISHANASKQYTLNYPGELISDITPPQISEPTATVSGTNAVTITWTTNEYTTSVIEYGLQPATYTLNVSDGLYRKNHEISLSDLTPGGVYYYRINDTDRGGNTYQSQEYSFTEPNSP